MNLQRKVAFVFVPIGLTIAIEGSYLAAKFYPILLPRDPMLLTLIVASLAVGMIAIFLDRSWSSGARVAVSLMYLIVMGSAMVVGVFVMACMNTGCGLG